MNALAPTNGRSAPHVFKPPRLVNVAVQSFPLAFLGFAILFVALFFIPEMRQMRQELKTQREAFDARESDVARKVKTLDNVQRMTLNNAAEALLLQEKAKRLAAENLKRAEELNDRLKAAKGEQ
jgi:uncharacterized protein YlxW (UPF0749 family)